MADFIDIKVAELETQREKILVVLEEIDYVLEKLKPFVTENEEAAKVLPLADLRKVKKQKKIKAAVKKRRDVKGQTLKLLQKGEMDRKQLIKKLGGDSSAHRAVRTLLDRGIIEASEDGKSLKLLEQTAA